MSSFVGTGNDRPRDPVPEFDEALGHAAQLTKLPAAVHHVVDRHATLPRPLLKPCPGLGTIDQVAPSQDSTRFSVAPKPVS